MPLRRSTTVRGALKPSLEGWKHDEFSPLGKEDRPLETFLRGMETAEMRLRNRRAGSLETFLRGMETRGLVQRFGHQPTALKPSLEGWKRVLEEVYTEAYISLKPSLEGWKLIHSFPSPLSSSP